MFSKTSAMATSLTGPAVVERALTAAPEPRPPQPMRAMRIVLSSAAKTWGMSMPARAEAAAMAEVVLRNSRRLDATGFGMGLAAELGFMGMGFRRDMGGNQWKSGDGEGKRQSAKGKSDRMCG